MSGSYNRWRGVEGGQLAGSYYIGEGRGGSVSGVILYW